MVTATGPTQHDSSIVHPMGDGRTEYRYRQSWLNTYWDCPERARFEAYKLIGRTENDAASVGTAFHATAEVTIRHLMETGEAWGPSDIVDVFDEQWAHLRDTLDIQWVKRKPKAATAYGRKISERWGQYVVPILDPYGVEIALPRTTVYEDNEKVISVTGTIDYADNTLGLVDWKSASRAYEPWQYERWAVQPTVYLGVWSQAAPSLHPDYRGPHGTWHYCVFPDRREPEPQWVRVTRTDQHMDWLVEQLLGITEIVAAHEAGHIGSFPKRDQHALCSPKWCPAYGQCKGKHIPNL